MRLFVLQRRLALFSLLLSFAVPTGAGATEKPWLIVIDVHETDKRPGNLDLNDGQAVAKLEKLFPGHPVALIRGNSNAEVRGRLKGFGSGNTKIGALYVMSHGSNQNLTLSRKDQKNYSPRNAALVNKKFVPVIVNEREDFYVELNDPASFNKVFEPIVGRFSDGAKILFTGCNTIEHGSPEEKLQVMKKVAKNFGLTNGTIYMNETQGALLTRSAFQQPFYEQNTLGEKTLTLLMQAFPWATVPALAVLENRSNRGYTLTVKGPEARLDKDTFFNAEKGKAPTGVRKGGPAASISDIWNKPHLEMMAAHSSQDLKVVRGNKAK